MSRQFVIFLLIFGFLGLAVPDQEVVAGGGPPALNTPGACGYPFPTDEYGNCTGSVNGCPTYTTTTINCPPGGGVCNGTNGNDCIIGSSNPDIINAGKGNDYICAYGGGDHVKASYGNDFVCGGSGEDLLEGGWGRDQMNGESEDDVLQGGQCNDGLHGGSGSGDICDGGLGLDGFSGCEPAIQGPIAVDSGTNCPSL